MRADAAFWDIFDHKLLKGRFYTKAEVDADRPVAVVTESTAARLFGNDEPLGNTVLVNHEPYEVVGVVADHTKLATSGSGDVFLPMSPAIVDGERTRYDFNANWDINMFGSVYVALLVKQGVDFSHVRDQVKARYAEIDTEIAEKGCRSVYHEAPYDQATLASGLRGSNSTPDTESGRNLRLLVYLILLIVPAINLSSMLHSRMRSRVSEIGVRRAYGCTRSRLIADIITENFLVTLAGSIIGLAMGVTVALTYDGLFTDSSFRTVHPSLGIILNWGVVATAVGFCFLLNLISASVPAWQASRVNPVQAINSSNK